MSDKRKLAPIGTTKTVDGVTFIASVCMKDGELYPNFIEWNGGARGGRIRERSSKSANLTCGVTGQLRAISFPRYEMGNDESATFPPIARRSILRQREAYEEAKAFVEAFEGQGAA